MIISGTLHGLSILLILFTTIFSVMAHETMEYDLQVQLDYAAEQSALDEVASSQGGLLLLQPPVAEVVSSQGGPLLPQPAPTEVVISQGEPPLLQPAPAEELSSQGGPHLLQPTPQVSIDLTEEVELLGEENVENINPGASEEHRQGSGDNRMMQEASLDSMSSFINGLQRLHGMLEFLRPPADHTVGPLRARRRRRSASRRARAGGSQRTASAR